jgi:hypothetical protein
VRNRDNKESQAKTKCEYCQCCCSRVCVQGSRECNHSDK